MSRPRQIPDKACIECGKVFRPHSWKQFRRPHACCTQRCRSRRGARLRPQQLQAATAASVRVMHQRARVRVEADICAQYGDLSDREMALFNLAEKIGYRRGYGTAYKRRQREEGTAA